ncbi:Osteopetrosis-associated transmembrane protein 1 [Triplophysa tibetana]|uniref:Osteopetrosis-associated transmembrane protein 1 n=1 Tax=Triplophysa tibetana TaxID=1572043 RepID=A0A5A9NHG1_9TELE|nr:Osteopetrosis-associated transmembrane protein 1 [Triplophysa tibetana]
MGLLIKCTFLTSCLFVWSLTLVKCTVYPPQVRGNGAINAHSPALDSESPALQARSLGYFYSLSLSSTFPDDLEVKEHCIEMLHIFGQRYVAYANCLVSYARPVKICQNCHTSFNSLVEMYTNISSDQLGPGNVSCHDTLMRSDRLMLLYTLFSKLNEIWTIAGCKRMSSENQDTLSNDTLYFMTSLNLSLTCFEKFQGNHSELCKDCKLSYKSLNELYGKMEENQTLCIDIEDSMNMTRRLWSKTFGCSFPREEIVPVIAVSCFMLFLPIIFYLSSFLHSEQKKRKLIHPNRAKSSSSLMNIQDKFS